MAEHGSVCRHAFQPESLVARNAIAKGLKAACIGGQCAAEMGAAAQAIGDLMKIAPSSKSWACRLSPATSCMVARKDHALTPRATAIRDWLLAIGDQPIRT